MEERGIRLLTSGSESRSVLILALPAMGGLFLQSAFNLVDVFWVGRLGPAALAAVWWAFASVSLIIVRNGTPGMLLAGFSFVDSVPPRRVPLVLGAAFLGVVTAGLGTFGGRSSLLSRAAESEIAMAGGD